MKRSVNVSAMLIVAAALGLSAAAQAGDVLYYKHGERPDPGDIARVLQSTTQPAAKKVRMRGIRVLDDEPREHQVAAETSVASQAVSQAAAQAEAGPGAFALQIQFPYNSADIPPDMIPALDAVGEGIKMAGDLRVLIEGHTDAHGAEGYNRQLSRRRANAVKQYLVTHHGLCTGALVAVGKGEGAPLLPDNPLAPENRRVEFRAAD